MLLLPFFFSALFDSSVELEGLFSSHSVEFVIAKILADSIDFLPYILCRSLLTRDLGGGVRLNLTHIVTNLGQRPIRSRKYALSKHWLNSLQTVIVLIYKRSSTRQLRLCLPHQVGHSRSIRV